MLCLLWLAGVSAVSMALPAAAAFQNVGRFPVASLTGAAAPAHAASARSRAEAGGLQPGSEQWHAERKKLNAMLWASLIIVTLLFMGLILITVLRMGRHYRKRVLGEEKPEPTAYVDAWSQYRLPADTEDRPEDS